MRRVSAVMFTCSALAAASAAAYASEPGGTSGPNPPPNVVAPPAPQASGDSTVLRVLRDKGIITQEEYDSYSKSLVVPATDEKHEPEPTIKYKPGGGFTFETADKRFGMTLGGYLQVRSQYTDFDEQRSNEDEWRFQVRRARIDLQGYLWETWMKYRIMIDAVGQDAVDSISTTTNNTGNVTDVDASTSKVAELKDGYFDVVPYEEFGVRAGQYKVPISRQFLISASRLQLPDRSIASEAFDYDRDMGVDFHGALSGRFFYDLGIYNGNGENHPTNPDGTRMTYNARVGVMAAGNDAKYLLEQEGDVKRTDDFLLAFEIGDVWDAGDTELNTLELSGIAKTQGFSAEAAYFLRDINPDVGGSTDDNGYYLQAGYMFTEHVEGALRRSGIDIDGVTENAEDTLGASYYFYEHNLKLQLAYTHLLSEPDSGGNRVDHRVVLELSARF